MSNSMQVAPAGSLIYEMEWQVRLQLQLRQVGDMLGVDLTTTDDQVILDFHPSIILNFFQHFAGMDK
jgi:hypothetical protein